MRMGGDKDEFNLIYVSYLKNIQVQMLSWRMEEYD